MENVVTPGVRGAKGTPFPRKPGGGSPDAVSSPGRGMYSLLTNTHSDGGFAEP